MTVMPQNVPDLLEDIVGLYKLGVNQFIIGHATGIKWSEKDIELFSKQYGQIYQWYKKEKNEHLRIEEFDEQVPSKEYFGCQAGRNSLSVSINGEISPCSKILALNNKTLLSKLGDIWYGLYCIKNRIELNTCNSLKQATIKSGIEKDFHGGCYVSNYDENRDLFLPSIQEHTIDIKKRAVCMGCNCSS